MVLDDNNYRRNHISRTRYLNEKCDFVWLSLPVGASQNQKINSITLGSLSEFAENELSRLQHAYRASQYVNEVWPCVEDVFEILLHVKSRDLVDINIQIIECLLRHLSFPIPKIAFSSKIAKSDDRSERLAEFADAFSEEALLIGDGSSSRIHDFSEIKNRGVKLFVSPFFTEHPVYRHCNCEDSFHPGLSVLDALFSVGFAGTANLIESVNLREA